MTTTLRNMFGAETGGLEECTATGGSPSAIGAGAQRSGEYCFRASNSSDTFTIPFMYSKADAGLPTVESTDTFCCIGFAIKFADVTPSTGFDFCAIRASAGGTILVLGITATGTLQVRDAAGNQLANVAGVFAVNSQYYYIEFAVERGSLGAADWAVYVDGSLVASGTGANTSSRTEFSDVHFASGFTEIHVDDGYILSDNVALPTRLGASQVFAYQTGNGTVDGDVTAIDLDTGVWNNMGKTPLETVTTRASFTGSPETELVHYNDAANGGRGPGPSGGAYTVNGTIHGVKGIQRRLRGSGAGSTHHSTMGVAGGSSFNTSGSLTTSPQTIGEVLTTADGAGLVPTSSQVLQQGFGVTGAQDTLCDEMWAMLLHTPPSGPVTSLPLVQNQPRHIQQLLARGY